MKKEYSNGELTVVWKPDLCIHAGECVKQLPNVYKPKEKPWINLKNEGTEALIKQISTCPSGALTYYLNENKLSQKIEESAEPIEFTVFKNGPLMVKGNIKIKGIDGKEEFRQKSTAFCRCGASENKPFCDGKHKGIDFIG